MYSPKNYSIVFLLIVCVQWCFGQVTPSEIERPHGILRIKLNNYYGSSQDILVINQYHDSSKTDTVISRLAMFDLGAIRNWPKGKVPERWAGFHYYSASILNRNVMVIISDGPKTMKLHLTNDSSLRDHNLSIPFAPGTYKMHLPDIKDFYTYNKNIEYLQKKALKTQLSRPERSGLKEQAFITFNSLDKFKVTQFTVGEFELHSEPFLWYPLAWLQYAGNTSLKTKIGSTPLKTLVESGFWPDDENGLCVYNKFVQVPRIYLKQEEDLNYCGTTLNTIFPQLSYPDYYRDCSHNFDSLQRFLYNIALQKDQCNSAYASLTKAYFTLVSDSLVSLVFETKKAVHTPNYLKTIRSYQRKIDSLAQAYNAIQLLKTKKKPLAEAKFYQYQFNVPMAFLQQEPSAFNQTDKIYHYKNKGTPQQELNQWNIHKQAYQLDSMFQTPVDTNYFQHTFWAINLNPYTMKIYGVRDLLPENALQIIYNEMLAIKKRFPERDFNEFQYQPDLNRGYVVGFTLNSILIYYGNEGEFGGWFIHEIAFEKLGL